MKISLSPIFRGLLAILVLPMALHAGKVLKINGSTTVNLPAAEAAEILRAEKGMSIQVDTQGGSSGGISMLGDGFVHIGRSSKPVSSDDRAKYPKVHFVETHIGEDAVAMIVSRDVWEGGVHALTKEQIQGIYEGSIINWKDVGGVDRRIVFFNKEPGRGTWEVFAHWIYGDVKKAPQVSFPEVGGNEETRTKVASTRCAILDIKNVSVHAGKKPILRDVSLFVTERQILGIVGSSGAGKSTLLRAINRLLDRQPGFRVEGSIRLRGQEIYKSNLNPDELRTRIGMLFQQPVVFPASIEVNVLFGLRHHRTLRRAEKAEAVEKSLRSAALWNEVKDIISPG